MLRFAHTDSVEYAQGPGTYPVIKKSRFQTKPEPVAIEHIRATANQAKKALEPCFSYGFYAASSGELFQ
jgi:hypothetical protein